MFNGYIRQSWEVGGSSLFNKFITVNNKLIKNSCKVIIHA